MRERTMDMKKTARTLEKEAIARKLLLEGKSYKQIREAIRAQFGKCLCNTRLSKLAHDVFGVSRVVRSPDVVAKSRERKAPDVLIPVQDEPHKVLQAALERFQAVLRPQGVTRCEIDLERNQAKFSFKQEVTLGIQNAVTSQGHQAGR